MKVTIEPTEDWGENTPPPRVSVEIANDDLAIQEVVMALIVPALMGYGFAEDIIMKYLNDGTLEDED